MQYRQLWFIPVPHWRHSLCIMLDSKKEADSRRYAPYILYTSQVTVASKCNSLCTGERLRLEEARSLLQVGGAVQTRSKTLDFNLSLYSWLELVCSTYEYASKAFVEIREETRNLCDFVQFQMISIYTILSVRLLRQLGFLCH